MSVKIEKIGKAKVKIEFEIEAEKFEQAMQKSFAKNSKHFNIPGFRKGKAPRHMVEKYYGESALYEDAFNIIAGEEYDKVVEENDISAVDKPEIDVVQIGSGKNLIFTAEVAVKPPVEISNYKGIEVKKQVNVVTEDDIEKELEKMREKNARVITVEDRKLENGDVSNINFEGFVDGVAFEGGKGEDYELTIGSGAFIKGFEEQLIGMEINEEKDITVTFPEEYHSKNLAGKESIFKVKLNGIKAKELPALDDEFAKDVSEFDTLTDLKKSIREKFEAENAIKAKNDMENELIDKLVEMAEIEIPQAMIERQIDYMVRDFDWRLSMQGANLDSYLKYTNSDMGKVRQMFKEQAEKAVKTQLVIEEIGKRENIAPAQEDIDAHIAKLAEGYNQEAEEFKKQLKEEDIKYLTDEVKVDKTISFLMEKANIVS
ncbi:MAG: trigger factor [Deltaproteobacteria bacterium]